MRGLTKMFFLAAVGLAVPAFAQVGAPAANPTNWVAALACIAMAIASAGCGVGQGKATASAAEAMARNPSARPAIQFALIFGLALIESLALYTLVIIFLKAK